MMARPQTSVVHGSLLALGLAAAMSTAQPAAGATDRNTLTVGVALEPPSLDPTSSPADPIRTITNGNLFEGLTWIDEAGHVVPRLATAWSLAPDGLTWTFHLRDHVRFSDGTPFDCGIVRFSYQRAAAPGSLNPQPQFFRPIAAIACPTPLTAVVTLKQPVGELPYDLAWPDAAMVAPGTAADEGSHPVGTGPYKFVSWLRGDNVVLTRNDGYWGSRPKIGTVRYRFIADTMAVSNALLSGALDAYPSIASQDLLTRFRDQKGFTVASGRSSAKLLLVLNETRKPFDDVRVRRALAYAIDRKGLAEALSDGTYSLIGSHMAPSDPDYVDLSGRYPYDPKQAAALLQQAHVGRDFAPAIAIPPIDYGRKVGELVVAYLAEVGIQARLQPISWPQWLSQVFGQGSYDMTVIAHVEPHDLDIYARPHYYFGYHDAAYDALYARYVAASDPASRHELSVALQRKLADDEPNVFLLAAPRVSVWNSGLHGLWRDAPVPAFPVGDAVWAD